MGWTSQGNIRGPQGTQGPTGATGATGPQGPSGVTTIAGASDYSSLSDPAAGTAGLRTLGTGAQQAAAGNDSRLSDARTPTAHSHAASDVNSGTLAIARVPTGTSSTTVALGNHTHAASVVPIAPVALTDAATIAVDASLGNHFRVTLGGNRTLGAPSNPTDGQKILVEVKQDATGSRTLAYNAIYRFGSDVTSPTLTTTASKTDFLGFVYNSTAAKWDCIAVAKGY